MAACFVSVAAMTSSCFQKAAMQHCHRMADEQIPLVQSCFDLSVLWQDPVCFHIETLSDALFWGGCSLGDVFPHCSRGRHLGNVSSALKFFWGLSFMGAQRRGQGILATSWRLCAQIGNRK